MSLMPVLKRATYVRYFVGAKTFLVCVFVLCVLKVTTDMISSVLMMLAL